MNWIRSSNLRRRAGLTLAAALVFTLLHSPSQAKASGADTNAPAAKPAKPAVKKKLTGSELYAINCNRCHPERYPTEFNSAQWKTLMLHMRVRAGIPAKQAKEILKYLQEDAGN